MLLDKSHFVSLEDFESLSRGIFGSGRWHLSYHDRTHLEEDVFIPLGDIEINDTNSQGYIFFDFSPTKRKQLVGTEEFQASQRRRSFKQSWIHEGVTGDKLKHLTETCENAAGLIHDQLAAAMVRLGLVVPQIDAFPIPSPTLRHLMVVLDTSALRTGALRHFQEAYSQLALWAVVPTVSIMEIGERLANVTSASRKKADPKNYKLIRTRPQVTIAPEEIKWVKTNFPTEALEVSSDMLINFRGYRAADTKDVDDFERVTVNDRLILEGIKYLRRQRNIPNHNLYSVNHESNDGSGRAKTGTSGAGGKRRSMARMSKAQ